MLSTQHTRTNVVIRVIGNAKFFQGIQKATLYPFKLYPSSIKQFSLQRDLLSSLNKSHFQKCKIKTLECKKKP